MSGESGLMAGTELVPVKNKAAGPPPIFIDTWHWVQSLTNSSNNPTNLSCVQAESIMMTFQKIASYRLHQWQVQLPSQTRLHQDLHLLRAISSELSRLHSAAVIRLDNEQRARLDRIASELHSAIDTLRDITTNGKTDLALAVNTFKAESKEDGQRTEMDLHKLEGQLVSKMSQFKSDSENIKVRSMYSFARNLPQYFP